MTITRWGRYAVGRCLAQLPGVAKPVLAIALLVCLMTSFSAARANPLLPADLKSLLERIREKRGSAPQVQATFQEEKKSTS